SVERLHCPHPDPIGHIQRGNRRVGAFDLKGRVGGGPGGNGGIGLGLGRGLAEGGGGGGGGGPRPGGRGQGGGGGARGGGGRGGGEGGRRGLGRGGGQGDPGPLRPPRRAGQQRRHEHSQARGEPRPQGMAPGPRDQPHQRLPDQPRLSSRDEAAGRGQDHQ